MLKHDNNPKDMLGRSRIIPLSLAMDLLQVNLPPFICEEEVVSLEEALGRVTAREIFSPEDLPPHPRSTMDGYAVSARDTFGASESLPAYFNISGEIRMGEFPEQGPSSGNCFAISTGGLLPPQTDAVVMLEHTVNVDDEMIEVVQPVAVGGNVITAGEDIKKGDLVFVAGHRMRPQELGLLAGLGIDKVHVYRRVRVGIFSTGDEIVEYQQRPSPGKIRDTNSVHLAALVRKKYGIPAYYGIAADMEENFISLFRQAIKENDLVLFSGGSSVGVRDLGERVIEKLGKPGIIFHGVAIKPGKPVIFAIIDDTALFGLPGHPVSAAVAFDLFVTPVLNHLSGRERSFQDVGRSVEARLMRNINSASGRTDFIRVQLRSRDNQVLFEAYPVLGKSGALSTMVKADGYIIVAEEKQGLKQGEKVEVQIYDYC